MVNYGSVFGLWGEETKDDIILKNAAKMNSKSHASIMPFKKLLPVFHMSVWWFENQGMIYDRECTIM